MNPKQTYISSNLNLPSQVSSKWKDWGSTKKLTNDGRYAISNPDASSTNPTAGAAIPSVPGATGTQQGSNAPASSLPSSGQTYAQRVAGVQEGTQNLQTAFDSYKQNQTAPAPEKPKDESEYLKYLRSMFNPDEARRAQENVNKLTEMSAKEIERNRTEQERIQKNEAGVIERGQTHLSTSAARESAKTLADLAIAKGYSTDILNQYMDAGASVQEAEEILRKEAESPLTIEEAQSLGVPFGTTMAEARQMGIVPSESGGTSGIASLAKMVMNGEMDMAGVPTDLRGAVAEAVQTGGGITDQTNQMSPYQQERITRNLNSIEDLMGQVSGWTTGMGSLIAAVPGTPAANFRADVNTLSANIAFGELTAMREASKTGGALGQVSERELALLEAALGSLDRAQSPEQFKKSLDTVKASIERWQAAVQEHGGGEGGEGGEGGLYDF